MTKRSPPGLHGLLRLIGRRPPLTAHPDVSEQLSSFDEAVVLAHKHNEEQWQVGVVEGLRRLAEITGEPVFKQYADKWQGYIDAWPTMPLYRDAGVMLTRYAP